MPEAPSRLEAKAVRVIIAGCQAQGKHLLKNG